MLFDTGIWNVDGAASMGVRALADVCRCLDHHITELTESCRSGKPELGIDRDFGESCEVFAVCRRAKAHEWSKNANRPAKLIGNRTSELGHPSECKIPS